MPKLKPKLGSPITRMRGMTAKGIASKNAVSPEGGKFGAGLIKRFAVVTRGEALGHGVWLDETFVAQTAYGLNIGGEKGIKSRYSHPGLSADGLAKFLGRAIGGQVDGDVLRSDLHLARSAHRTPDGDLAGHVLSMASEDPEAFGASIVYEFDEEREKEHFVLHGGKITVDRYGYEEWDNSKFKSPDPLNLQNLPHARLKSLRAVDIVGDPAANPSGVFDRDPVFSDAEKLMLFAIGESDSPPKMRSFDVDPRRLSTFVSNFLNRHNLTISRTQSMSQSPAPTEQAEKPPVDPAAEFAARHKQYVTEFGTVNGNAWLAEGKSIEESRKLHAAEVEKQRTEELAAKDKQIESLTKERDELKTRIDQAKLGDEKGVTFQAEGDGATEIPRELSSKLAPGVAKFVANERARKQSQ